jgi:hypothetical protein
MTNKINANDFQFFQFPDGEVGLSCGGKGMETVLVFASGAMCGDPALEYQRRIIEFILESIKYAARRE